MQMVYNVGLVGAGNVTTMHLDGLINHPERVRVTAICDPDQETLEARANAYGIPQRFTKLDDLLAKGNVDVVVVCTPTTVRKEVLFPIIEAGLPVFVEKPFSETYREAVEIAEKAKKHGVKVSVNQNFRKHYTFDLIRRILAENTVGTVMGVIFHDLFDRQDTGWRTGRERNAMSVMGIHWFDGFRWILHCEAESLVCRTHNSPAKNYVGDTESFVQIAFENGTTVSYAQSFSGVYRRNEMMVIGETGMLAADYHHVSLYRKGEKEAVRTWDHSYPKSEATFDGLHQLLTALETGEEAANSAEDNIKSVALLDAAYISAREQRIVKFQPGGWL